MATLPAETKAPDQLADVAQALADRFETTRAELESLVRIPSISFEGHDPATLRTSAERTAEIFRGIGLENVQLLEVEGAHPYVYADHLHAGNAPTVLMYAHHDVQPVGTPDRWNSEPFEPTERDGRLYGRGAADDKAGIMAHVGAIAAWLDARGELPVNVKVIIEGEEEIGSPHLHDFLDGHVELLRADVIVLTDLTNWQVGWPGLTYALRGMGEVYVTVKALEQPVHNGMYGGPVPDALTGLLKALASLNDETGQPAVAGIYDDVRELSDRERQLLEDLHMEPERLRAEAGMLDGVEFVGNPELPLLERNWMRPTITVIGIDCPSVTNASNQLIAEARAKLNLRLAPGQDPARVQNLVAEHLEANVPWGLHTEVTFGPANAAWVTEPTGPAFDAASAAMEAAYGRPPALLGCGGSIPFVEPFSDAFGGAPCLLVGIEDPHTNAHGEDESLHLGDFMKSALSEAFLFAEIADRLG